MGDLLKKAGTLLTKKTLFWVVGLIGGSTVVVVLGIVLVLMLLIIAIIGGSTSSQQSEYEGSSGVACSPTGEIDMKIWDSMWNDESWVGVMKGQGSYVLDKSREINIDPVLVSAVMIHETGRGKSHAVKNRNNPAGVMNPGGIGLRQFSSLKEGMEYSIENLGRRIHRDGLVELEELAHDEVWGYAPLNAANDPKGLNKRWVPLVTEYASMFGGFTMNCEAGGVDIAFEGDVSELRKNVATVGNKWVGRTKYVFGGGRTASSIARGDFDCSSFVHWAYGQNGMDLGPVSGTSTETLNKMGKKISINEIKVGDLIFWDTYKKDGHVGIYVGNGKFIGSQSRTGVAIVDVNNTYWKSVFSGHVRRLIED